MELNELIKMRGFDLDSKIKLVRHQDKNFDVHMLYRQGFLEFYQSTQSKDVFGKCDYILSFIGNEGNKATFVGAYKKLSTQKLDIDKIPIGYPYATDFSNGDYFYYDFLKIELLSDLVDRLIIDWGKATISWHQWLNSENSKTVIEILPIGYTKEFPGYEDLNLTFSELERVVNNKDANRIWHNMLESVAGIYLIVDTKTGLQYIGSAYGEDGILGRWRTYVNTRHGNNRLLIDLLKQHPNRYQNFQFSVLQTLPRAMNKDQVIRKEQVYKIKLGTKAFGLNGN